MPPARFRRNLVALCLTLLALLPPCASMAATRPGTNIDNTATATFSGAQTATSNMVRITTVVKRTLSTITFLQYAPADSSAVNISIPATAFSTTGDLANPLPTKPVAAYDGYYKLPAAIPVVPASIFHGGQPLLIKLQDLDQNLDPTVAEQVWVRIKSSHADGTIDEELLLLTEDGTDSGIFYGYVLTALNGSAGLDGVLAVKTDCDLKADYLDIQDGSDTSVDAALVDPYGIVFDSLTGEPVNGASVTLWDATANSPANVFDDFGRPGYPSTVTTGDATLGFPPGGFRFPQIVPGREYRLIVLPPAGYQTPSAELPDTIRARFNQYVIDNQASYGRAFFVNPGPAINIDIPADPSKGGLWLRKEAGAEIVAIGDFLQYTLTLENTDGAHAATGVSIEDRLPLGFRYQKGSLRIASAKAEDPQISGDGRTLTIGIGRVAPGQILTITYVVEVAAGAKSGEAINQAFAADQTGNRSNLAEESVTVKDVFFRNKAFVLGRVMIGSCSQDDLEKEGLPGARIYLEDGTYVVTDGDGRYHFEGIDPGVHVVQLDIDTVPAMYEVLPCEQNSQFAGRSFSQFVDLQGGTLWRADFYVDLKPKLRGEVGIELSGKLDGQKAAFEIPIKIGAVPLTDLRLSVILPGGLEYRKDSSTIDGISVDDPEARGPVFIYRLGDRPAEWSGVVALQTLVAPDSAGELPAKAVLTFNSPEQKNQRTPMADTLMLVKAEEVRKPLTIVETRPNFPSFVADLSAEDKIFFDRLAEQLRQAEIDRIYVVGHADDMRIAPRSQHIFADNTALSEARASSVARYLGDALKLPPDRIVVKGMGDTQPVADRSTEEGRALNRRVELRLEGVGIDRTSVVELTKAHSGLQKIETVGARPGEEKAAASPVEPDSPDMPVYDSGYLAEAKPGISWLWPENNHVPSIPSIKVAIQHQPGQQVKLLVNGEEASPLAFEGTQQNSTGTVAVSIWRGVGVVDGDNRLEAVVTDVSGNVVERLTRNVHSSYGPVSAEYVEEGSVLVADGRTVPMIRVLLKDKDGYPVREGMVGDFAVAPPYRPLQSESIEDRSLNSAQQIKYQVGPGGIAAIRLEPTPQAGEAIVRIRFEEGSGEIRAWLKPAPRDWILVGFAEGTAGYSTIHDNQVSAEEAGIDEHGYTDGRVKFFAKGAIKGEWLLTLAYDSDKPDLDGDSLQQIIDPDTYYPLYGDETQQGYEAASARDIYVKLERDQFYALFGDMQTGLTQTELSQYSRSMNGFKAEQQSERFAYTVFAADTKQSFVKDELRGDGTAGRYSLSQSDLVINSEEVVIETRDRFHNERILKEERLSRHVDYDIDYDAGTLWFKRPVPSKDQDFNPVFLVVRYETRSSDQANFNYGGRGAVKLLDGQVEVGASLVHEENGAAEGDLYGADVTVDLTPQTTLHAEVATTDVEEIDEDRKGDAYLAEIEHRGEKLDGKAWFRQQDPEFGLGQQNGGTEGMRTYGAEGAYRFTPQWTLAGEAYHEDNLDTDAKRDVATVEGQYRAERYGLMAGLREARDKFDDGEKQTSRQMLLGGDWSTPDRKLTLRATHEQSVGSSDENADFPTRTMIGADYHLTRNVSLFAEQEFTWGEQADTEGTRVGLKATPWQGGEVRTAVERQAIENGERIFALFGVGQTWQVTQLWSIDLAVDRSYTIKNEPAGERVNPAVPQASGGDDDFTAVSVGAAYRAEKWSWWNRLETRQGDSEDKVGISSGVVGEVREGTAVSARLMAFITDSAEGGKRDEEEITLGMAYRPDRSKWIILERLDLSLANEDGDGTGNDSWRIVNHIHANYRASRQWQTSFYYGLKYVRENFDGDRYDGYTDMLAVETRYNVNERWDVGLHAAVLHSWNSDQFDYSLGGDVGYLVMTNAWVSAGYNLVGFEDDDFSDASYTAEGPYMRFRMKFDQQSVKEAAEWLNK